MAVKAVRSLKPMALSPVAKVIIGRKIWETEAPIEVVNQPPVVSGAVNLGSVDVGTGLVVSTNDLLAGATDPNGDTLSVSGLTVTTGSATITGTGPYTITPSAAGSVVISYAISDGNGGSIAQTANITATTASITPTISSVVGTIADGQTITVSGSGLGQAPTLLRIKGDEGDVGTSVAAATGMTVHGSTGNEWLFESGGTMVLDMQADQPKTVYKALGSAHADLFVYYERQHFDVGPLNVDGNGQVKELRFAGTDDISNASDDPALGTGWDVENESLWRYHGLLVASNFEYVGATRARMQEWSSQIIAGRIIGDQTHADFETFGSDWAAKGYDHNGTVNDAKGWGQIFLPYYRTGGFSTSMRMRNVIALAGRQRFEVGNNADRSLCTRVVAQHAATASTTSATIPLDLTRFKPEDGLYLFAVNASGEYSAAHELHVPVAPPTYDPLADDYGVKRLRSDRIDVPDYSAAALAADSLRFQIGFVVDGLDAGAVGTPIGICLSSSASSAFRGHLRIDHVTGDIVIRAMTNNVGLTLKTASDVHTNLGVRRDWELVVPKNTGELATLTDLQTDSLIGSTARTSTFDGFYPTRWMFCNTLAAQGSLNGRMAYLRCFATTGGVETTLFDFRFTAEQAGLTSVPSAHDSGVVATLGAALTWGAA